MSIPIAKYLKLLPYLNTIFAIVTDIEATFGPGTGTQKKQAATKALTDILLVAEPLIAQNNPAFEAELHGIIDEVVKLLNRWAATLKEKPVVVPPVKPPVIVPPAVDPTTIEYTSIDDAITHISAEYPNVILKANARYVVWPQIGPYPGRKVWPEDAATPATPALTP